MWWGIFFIAISLFTIIGVVIFNIGMNTRKAQRMVKLIGVTGAKIVYTIIGVFCLVYGIMLLTGAATIG